MAFVEIKDTAGATVRGVDVGNLILPDFKQPAGVLQQTFDALTSYKLRDDDVMIISFPKSGSNWLYQIVKMVLKRDSEPVASNKSTEMLEANLLDDLDKLPSPRVLNTHLLLKYLPKDLRRKQIKTILLLRNPKDTAVSFFNFMKGMYSFDYNGEWGNWLDTFLTGKLPYGKITDYCMEWEKDIKAGVGFPLLTMHYEDMIQNTEKEFDRLLDFLGLNLESKLKREIILATGFEKMSKSHNLCNLLSKRAFKEGYTYFRKGQVGDWRNWFTDDQNATFDDTWNSETAGLGFSFKYE